MSRKRLATLVPTPQATRTTASRPSYRQQVEQYADEAMDIHDTLAGRMQQMTAEEFESVLRPVFQQDEWELIAVGAVLDFPVGELQVFVMPHHQAVVPDCGEGGACG